MFFSFTQCNNILKDKVLLRYNPKIGQTYNYSIQLFRNKGDLYLEAPFTMYVFAKKVYTKAEIKPDNIISNLTELLLLLKVS